MWDTENDKLEREFKFADFKSALDFVNKVGKLGEQMNHHPDIELGWGRVKVSLTTHDADGITDKDNELAAKIDKLI